jgi:hypothetical protein
MMVEHIIDGLGVGDGEFDGLPDGVGDGELLGLALGLGLSTPAGTNVTVFGANVGDVLSLPQPLSQSPIKVEPTARAIAPIFHLALPFICTVCPPSPRKIFKCSGSSQRLEPPPRFPAGWGPSPFGRNVLKTGARF